MEKKTIVFSAFPGMGKSYCHNECKKNKKFVTLDSDSSKYSWRHAKGEKVRNGKFPENYIKHIKKNMGKVDIIFVSSHLEVRRALKAAGIRYYVVIPLISRKKEMLALYKKRGNDKEFIKLLRNEWECWVAAIALQEEEADVFRLAEETFLNDMIETLVYNIRRRDYGKGK